MKFIGIDPDVYKSGVAVFDKQTHKLELYNVTFFEMFEMLKNINPNLIVIEAGWLNKSNWHKVSNGTASVNAQIGQRTGANHETGKKIVEMCEYLNLKYELVKPTKSKVNTELFAKMTGIKKSNQEQRDAGMLVIGR